MKPPRLQIECEKKLKRAIDKYTAEHDITIKELITSLLESVIAGEITPKCLVTQ